VRDNAVNRLKIDGMLKDDRLVTPGSPYYQNKEMYALHSFAFYKCFKCKEAYFGGRRNCEQNQVENRDPAEMICFDCGDVPKVACKYSKKHAEFHEWKCRYCCSIAIWFCWGTTHFCEPCHQKAYELRDRKKEKLPKCPGKELCPLKMDHPPTGTEFSLGCGLCNNEAQQGVGGKKIDDKKGKEEEEDGGIIGASIDLVKEGAGAVYRRFSSRNKK
jgi:E3 ubiquitin-protein ligase MYCBP2